MYGWNNAEARPANSLDETLIFHVVGGARLAATGTITNTASPASLSPHRVSAEGPPRERSKAARTTAVVRTKATRLDDFAEPRGEAFNLPDIEGCHQ